MISIKEKYNNETVKQCLTYLEENWIKDDIDNLEIMHLYEWLNILEDISNLISKY